MLIFVFISNEERKDRRNTISDSGHEVNASGHVGEEGRFRPRKYTVSCQESVDPCVSEWGNPIGRDSYDYILSEVGI